MSVELQDRFVSFPNKIFLHGYVISCKVDCTFYIRVFSQSMKELVEVELLKSLSFFDPFFFGLLLLLIAILNITICFCDCAFSIL